MSAIDTHEDSLAGIDCDIEELSSYAELSSASPVVYTPKDEEQLRRIFAFARQDGRRVTIRAGGHSFDAQALGADIVVSMRCFDGIDIAQDKCEMTVGAGATWGAIVPELERRGLVAAVTVTTSHATAGGTLAGDCQSRFSPAWGKEGRFVKRFRFLSAAGDWVECERPEPNTPWGELTPAERAFRGVIGGLGYLGAVVSITYRLLAVKEATGRIGVRTDVTKATSFEGLVGHLVPAARQVERQEPDTNNPELPDALYSVLVFRGGKKYALHFRSAFTTDGERNPMYIHQPTLFSRVFAEWAVRVRWLAWLIWPVVFRKYDTEKPYIDDLAGYSFFVDGNVRAKEWAGRFGRRLKTIQQTFIVPCDVASESGCAQARQQLLSWLDTAQAKFDELNLTSTLLDVLYLPQDEPFLLSATGRSAGFSVSYAIETSKPRTLELAKQAFTDLSDVLGGERYQGRVYLVKNVAARSETLQAMYGEDLIRFKALKNELDPSGILRNDFLERTLGGP